MAVVGNDVVLTQQGNECLGHFVPAARAGLDLLHIVGRIGAIKHLKQRTGNNVQIARQVLQRHCCLLIHCPDHALCAQQKKIK